MYTVGKCIWNMNSQIYSVSPELKQFGLWLMAILRGRPVNGACDMNLVKDSVLVTTILAILVHGLAIPFCELLLSPSSVPHRKTRQIICGMQDATKTKHQWISTTSFRKMNLQLLKFSYHRTDHRSAGWVLYGGTYPPGFKSSICHWAYIFLDLF